MNKTKVIVTVGPTTSNYEILKSLIINGADVIRLNMSYASFDFCYEVISKVNDINKQLNTYASIMIDIKGPVVRIGRISNGNAFLKKDDKIRIFMNPILGDCTKFSVDYSELINDVEVGNIIKIDDGLIELQIVDKGPDYLLCKVLKEGYIIDNKSLVIPGIKLKRKFLSDYDKQSIKFAHEMNVDFLALSYVSDYEDVLEVNDLLIDLKDEQMQIISKIENNSAILDIDRIIKVSDGIIIARGDLGAEIAMDRIPGIQKKLLAKCRESAVIGIVSTELLSTMVNNNRPTRAEVSDIANAVLDGTDAVMLSSETAIGKYPIETLKTMEKIIKTAEKDIDYNFMIEQAIKNEIIDTTSSLAYSVATISEKLKCKAIFAPTMSGHTAKKISRYRPLCPIIAVSPNIQTVKSLSLSFGVYPILVNELKSIDAIIEKSRKISLEFLMLQQKDKIIITGGYPFKKANHTNFMKIEEI